MKITKKVSPAFEDFIFNWDYEQYLLIGGYGSGKSYHIAFKIILKLLNEKRKASVCPFDIPRSASVCHDGSSARAEHKAHGGNYHNKRHHDVYRLKCHLTREVGNEKTVHYSVYGHKHHHKYGRQRKAYKLFIGKML